jgi:putative DNA primase/helicase
VFVLPHEVIGPPTSREVYLQTDEASRYSVSGTLADWKREIGNSVSPHTLLVFGICAAFAGPLLMPAGLAGLGIHFFGKSSLGKTTLLQCATSVWSNGSESGKYLTNWQSTPNALEVLAMLASDTTLPVDEMSAGDPDKVSEIVYRILNGVGRSRLNANASLREIPTWRVTVISTGEKSMKEKLAERGRKALAGQEVRLINVPVGDHGVLIDHEKPGEVIDRLKAAAGTFYGTAGPAFVRRLTSDPTKYSPEEIRRRAHAIRAGWVTQDASPEVGRAAWYFAVVALAGELAIEFGIVDWAPGAAQAAAKAVFDSWVEERGGQATSASDEDLRATLRKTLLMEAARFTNVEDLRDARGQEIELRASGKRLGFVKGRGKERKWLFSYETWDEVFGGEQRGAAAIKLLAADGVLDSDKDDRATKRHRVGKGNLRYLTVTWKIAADENDPILYDRPVGSSAPF